MGKRWSVCEQALVCVSAQSLSRVRLFATLWTVARQAPLSMGVSGREHWKGLPCPPPGDLPHPEIECTSLTSLVLAGGFFTTSTTWEASEMRLHIYVDIDIDVVEGNGTPRQYSCLENPMDGGAWKAAVHWVAEGRTRLSDFTFPFHFHTMEKEMATHSSVLAWRIPGTAEPGGLPSMGLHRVGPDRSETAAAAACIQVKPVWYL